jgi:predicted regulator of Ras-like GTPase activity (Roadblock/LC7/MglB family)
MERDRRSGGCLIEDLRGSLAFTTLTDVVQFLHTTGRTGELWVEGGPEQRAAQVYFERGSVYHAQEGSNVGIDALVEIISWVEGSFIFSADKMVPSVSIEDPLPNILVEAARRLDEHRRRVAELESERAPQRMLEAFVESSGAVGAILMERDGSPIASAGHDNGDIDMTALSRDFGSVIETIDRLGSNQNCQPFDGSFIEFDRIQLLCLPVSAAVLVVVAPSQAQLGVIRHKTQHLADELAQALDR